MSKINELHDKAMEFCDEAFFAKRKGNSALAKEFSYKALKLETQAAEVLKDNFASEPSRSVLYRSAASIALDCEEFRLAEKLISTALIGNPPEEIAEELRDLLEQANFKRHLKLRNIDILTSSEIQLSMTGNEVGYGTILAEVFLGRLKDFERTLYRTVERLLGKEFRERGATDRTIQQNYNLYMTAPRTGSFSVTLHLGSQLQLPGIDLSVEVIDEVLECFKYFNSGDEEKLRKRIPQEAYYINFVSLAKRIAPDGEKVSMVGLTKVRDNKEIGIEITRKRKEISVFHEQTQSKEIEEGEILNIKGRLLFADARKAKNKIQLVEESMNSHQIIVPNGMMDDIVRPLWDEIVIVKGKRAKKHLHLIEIYKAE